MIVDDVTIQVFAGAGGRGAVAFNKNMKMLGPSGGSGGAGGNVYLEGVSDLTALNQFKSKRKLVAQNGRPGRDQFRDGSDGESLVLKVPIGTVVNNRGTGAVYEVIGVGERVLAAKGGLGGRGNFLFRSSRNTTPMQFQPGTAGESFTLRLELKYIADVGLIGFPNAGKSSLLNELTSAQSKVANYPFTTLEPNLGVYYELILADIPGLIEGASEGKGLGIKFLRHIDRTKVLFHLVSAESDNPVRDYRIIRNELRAHNKELLEKEEFVFLSKSDMVSEADISKKIDKLKKEGIKAIPISMLKQEDMNRVRKILSGISNKK